MRAALAEATVHASVATAALIRSNFLIDAAFVEAVERARIRLRTAV